MSWHLAEALVEVAASAEASAEALVGVAALAEALVEALVEVAASAEVLVEVEVLAGADSLVKVCRQEILATPCRRLRHPRHHMRLSSRLRQ